MTEIEYCPIQKIIIHQLYKHSFNDFVKFYAYEGTLVRWCEGIIFSFVPAPATDQIMAEQLKGTYHYMSLSFCKADENPGILKRGDAAISTPVNDNSHIPAYTDLVKWLKTQPIWSEGENEEAHG